jgi:adenosyl cobinamide kinase/adenosyl cobinamide phosphate guanylyltransferase
LITLVLGGTRSGKSEVAEALLADAPGPVTYVATGEATDDGMAGRIAAHRARRPDDWSTVEAGTDLAAVVADLTGHVLVDSLGTWVARDAHLEPDGAALCAALAARDAGGTGDTVVVSEEVGLGVHAATEVGRRFADALGTLNRAVAARSDRVLLVVAGRVLPLEPGPGTG